MSDEDTISTLTKMKLTGYLRQKILEYASVKSRRIVVAWETQCKETLRATGTVTRKRKMI